MMWIVQLALRQKHTFIVVALAIVIFGVLTLMSMPMDVLPTIDIPVVAVIWIYPGMQPQEMASRFITVSERAMTTTVNDIEHMESQTYPGAGVIKVYLHPGANVASAVAQVTATNQYILRYLPAGTTPPQVLQFNASNVPILYLATTSPSLSTSALFDLNFNFLRTQLATVQGTSVPTPYGGAPRQIMVDLNIPALQASDLSPTDVINAINANNLVTPTGTVKIGQTEYNVKTNNQPDMIPDFNSIPVKTINGTVVRIGDVAYAHDSHAVPISMVNLNGQPAVLTTILKTANASSIDVVRGVKQALPKIQATLPPDMHFAQLFDQTVYVSAAVQSVLREAVIAACLAALMVLLFLGSWRSTLVVATSIPVSILTSIILLGLLGQTINIMSLGGLALSVGILVDNAMVAVENINRNMAMGGKTLTRAILDGSAQIATPTLVATLSICIVFAPVLSMTGAAKSLFLPLAEAVVFAMLASFLLSRSLVPLMVQLLVRPDMQRIVEEERHIETTYGDYLIPHHVDASSDSEAHLSSAGLENERPQAGADPIWRVHHRFAMWFGGVRQHYAYLLQWTLAHRRPVALAFLLFFACSLALAPFIGEDFFPTAYAGQITLHVQGPPGLRLEETNHLCSRVEQVIREVIPPQQIDAMLDNIGLPSGGTNLAYASSTQGELDGDILISLKQPHGSVEHYMDLLRRQLPAAFPNATFYFEPSDIMTQILNFGLPAPIDIQLVGRDPRLYAFARKIADDVRGVPGATDVHIHQVQNVPELNVDVDRYRAATVGLTQHDVVNDLMASLAGTGQAAPNYWVDPKNGVGYLVAVQTPQRAVESIDDVRNTPIIPGGTNAAAQPGELLSNVATISPGQSPQIFTDYNIQPTMDVYVTPAGRDLGGVARDVNRILARYQKLLPRGTTVVMRGQIESMNSSFMGLGFGLIFAVLLAYLLMVINFQSWIDPLVIVTGLTGAISGILWMLFVTQTTFNVPSLMGSLMCVGIAVSNSILLVTYANERRAAGAGAVKAAVAAGFTRLRPILMTALALILGMLPMALGLGEGAEQNAPLGRAVIGGVLVATFATLFFVPIVYTILLYKAPAPTQEEIDLAQYDADEEDIRTARLQAAREFTVNTERFE